MIHWLFTHIEQIIVPFTTVLGIVMTIGGFTALHKQKAGLHPPYLPKTYRATLFLLVLADAFLIGVEMVRAYG